jgi:hypothetical protein
MCIADTHKPHDKPDLPNRANLQTSKHSRQWRFQSGNLCLSQRQMYLSVMTYPSATTLGIGLTPICEGKPEIIINNNTLGIEVEIYVRDEE